MAKDYYQTLELSRDASETEIAKSYRKLALKYHPQLSKDDANTSYHYFCGISEAYEVLSDPVRRAFYDKYGEQKLKEGFFEQDDLRGGYRFGGNPEQIFEKFFGTNNPFSQIYDKDNKEEYGSLFGHAFGNLNYGGLTPPATLEVVVECTLSELYNGCSKVVTYNRTVLNPDGRTTREVQENRQIEIKPGFDNNSTLFFNQQGHQAAGLTSSDLVLKIKQIENQSLKRKNNDLIYHAKYSLADALCCEPVQLTALDGRKLCVCVDEVIGPKTVKLVKGEGMPIYNSERLNVSNLDTPIPRGDLYIKFDIQFPKVLSLEQKQQLRDILA